MNHYHIPENRSYLVADNELGGTRPRFVYMKGNPKNIRFNGQKGQFTFKDLHSIGESLTLIPMAWRIFEGSVFGRANAKYLELYYVDQQRAVCCVMFTNTSVDVFEKFCADLVYMNKAITETEITITAAKRTNKTTNSSYHIAQFAAKPANPRAVQMLAEFAEDWPIYRAETREDQRDTKITEIIHSPGYFSYPRYLELAHSKDFSHPLLANFNTEPSIQAVAKRF